MYVKRIAEYVQLLFILNKRLWHKFEDAQILSSMILGLYDSFNFMLKNKLVISNFSEAIIDCNFLSNLSY